MKEDRKDSREAFDFPQKYERYCRELDKEDGLINDRVNWLLVSQSILFAAVGLAGEGPGRIIVKIVPWVGCALAVTIGLSVLAAIKSFWDYRALLKESRPQDPDLDRAYPQLQRNTLNIWLGFVAPILLPVIFAVAWVFVLLPR